MHRGAALVVAAAIFLSLAGCPATQRLRAQVEERDQRISELQARVGSLEQENAALRRQLAETEITLYFASSTPGEFFLVPEVRKVKREENMAVLVLRELIAGPSAQTDARPVLPKEVRILGVSVEKQIASADFSQEITRLNVGSTGEALVISAIVNTLTKLPGIERVRILVEGKQADTLAGHVDTTQPLRRNDNIVRI